ncbi:hypothetical protein G9A89_012451 [Geosiphon pyriformis]|nr:hypothetical protein G9A89_012451 [Geosiphon pyriformis]
MVLGLYAGASSKAKFGQTSKVNSLIAKTVNTSTFVVLGGDFNENRSEKSASIKFCLDLGLVNLFSGYYLAKASMWSNSKEVEKTIDFIFVSGSLFSAVANHKIGFVSDFFDTDHKAVMVSVNLGGLLDICLNNTDGAKWTKFRECSLVRLAEVGGEFLVVKICGNLDVMWKLLEEIMVRAADKVFFRHWFSVFQCSHNKQSSKFFGLELLIAKIIKKLESDNMLEFRHLAKKWLTLDYNEACGVLDIVQRNKKLIDVFKQLSMVRKKYRKSKLYELKLAEEAFIRKAIEKRIESFCLNKDSMIKSILNKLFCKVVLDHLVVDNELVLDPKEVLFSVDKIIESWTRK